MSKKKKSECQKDGHFKSCCCGCVNRVELLDNDSNPIEQTGWGCAAIFVIEGGAIFIGDFEHGLCELWSPK